MNKKPSPNAQNSVLKEGVDFIFNDAGLMVLTKEYHLKRGYCCSSGCQNCPYGYGEEVNSDVPLEIQLSEKESDQVQEAMSAEDYLEKYSDFIDSEK